MGKDVYKRQGSGWPGIQVSETKEINGTTYKCFHLTPACTNKNINLIFNDLKADEERERNMAPLEESLAVSDKRNMRMLMLNVIRGDMQKSLESITEAA